MATIFGNGDLRFEFVPNWEQKPPRFEHDDVSGICTDDDLNVYTLCRGRHPIMVYDRDGKFLDCFGEGEVGYMTGGLSITADGELLAADDGGNVIRRFSRDGELLGFIGPSSGEASATGWDGKDIDSIVTPAGPYNRPAKASEGPNGEIYVADGEGNCQIHRFSADGKLLQSWGEPGTGPGQFKCAHGIHVHTDGRVFVADRQNDRIQIFGPEGEFLESWEESQRPHDVFVKDDLVYVIDSFYPKGSTSSRRGPILADEAARMSIYDLEGNLMLRWSEEDTSKPGALHSPHGLWVDAEGSIYIANNSTAGAKSRGEAKAPFDTQKFVRV